MPHRSCTIPFEKFSPRPTRLGTGAEVLLPLIWINTWNHAFGEANNNPQMDMVHYLPSVCTTCPTVDPTVAAELHRPSPSDRVLSKARAYQVCVGCRAEVDGRFHGLISTFHSTTCDELERALGKRLC
uniref:Uncharacterized protein n=1 Tax=Calcidiscus leptoporus TaxID=127549 RepID=A0A7S0IWS0_9EUKA|mmetsp:Transcript_27049/g.63184  ORF Transcript_27049/g.63184 Transcript_27049/m.63184 type:complete len:128 (+) Transcript_27049:453-836(+)